MKSRMRNMKFFIIQSLPLLSIVNEGKKRTSKFSGKSAHPDLTEKLTLDHANIMIL